MVASQTWPRISVIIPARNEAGSITACLSSLLSQDIDEDFEIVVVDNGSSDATAELVSSFPVRLVPEPRPGRSTARNAGIRAARGDVLAFTDADCVPRTSWLRELLRGSSDPGCGCFVGEITMSEPSNIISRYCHDRELICQLRLLSQTMPVAATGNIAYRREVFGTIGLFDEAFTFGEDGDLFWRMVRSERFRYRYNPDAVVAHRHPARLGEFIRRSFHEGEGLTRFRRKHREDLPLSMSSGTVAAIALLKTLAGCALYPVRAARGLASRSCSPQRALTDPLFDKLGTISRLAGALNEHARGPSFTSAAANAGGRDVDTAPFQTVMDLDRAPLLCVPDGTLRDRVRTELRTFGNALAEGFPGSSILLTGSLFAGEGRLMAPEYSHLASDYDLFVITPRLPDAIPTLSRAKVRRLADSLPPFCTDVEIGVVWKPLLAARFTTVGGAVIAGSPDIVDILDELPAPRGFSALLQAYRSLTAAPLDPTRYTELCAGGLVRAARALMFAEKEGQPRTEWIALFSNEVVGERITGWAPVLGRDATDTIRDAAGYLLDRNPAGPQPDDHPRYARILEEIAPRIPLPRSGVFMTKQLYRIFQARRGNIHDNLDAGNILKSFQELAASWSSAGMNADRLDAAERACRKLGLSLAPAEAQHPMNAYGSIQRAISEAACFNPHRISCPRRKT